MQVCFVEKLNEATVRWVTLFSLCLTCPASAKLYGINSEEDVAVS